MKYLTPQEVADRYGVSKQSIHNWVKKGLIPFDMLGNRFIIIAETDIPTYLRERKKI